MITGKIKTAGLFLSLMVVSALAWSIHSKYVAHTGKPVKKVKDTVSEKPVYDKALLSKFEHIYQRYDTLKNTCTMTGMINLNDEADSSASLKNVEFIFCKRNGSFYYKLGRTETINNNGLYLYIDHIAKTIVISQQKAIAYDDQVMPVAGIPAHFSADNYQLSSHVTGKEQTLTFINDHHISCKQLSVSFDTTDMRINLIHARLTNLLDPLSTTNEKIIDITIGEWDGSANLDRYLSQKHFITKNAGKWQLLNAYKDYHLINME